MLQKRYLTKSYQSSVVSEKHWCQIPQKIFHYFLHNVIDIKNSKLQKQTQYTLWTTKLPSILNNYRLKLRLLLHLFSYNLQISPSNQQELKKSNLIINVRLKWAKTSENPNYLKKNMNKCLKMYPTSHIVIVCIWA